MSYGLFARTISVALRGYGNRLLLIEAKPEKPDNEIWLRDQIEALPTVSRLARERTIKLFTYSELINEAWRRPGSFPAPLFGDVFRNSDIDTVASAIERSKLYPLSFNQLRDGKDLNNYVELLINLDKLRLRKIASSRQTFTEFENESIEKIDELKLICRRVSKIQYADAFHLWTGIRNKIDFFLLIDNKFLNAVTNQGSIYYPCQPISSSDLLRRLEIPVREPLPYIYGKRYLLSGQPYE